MRIFKSIILCLALAVPALTQNQPTLTILATFPAGTLAQSVSPLLQGGGGNFFGILRGSSSLQYGTIFRMTQQGKLRMIFHFGVGVEFGYNPAPMLVEGRGGYLFGSTSFGPGGQGDGTVFKSTLDGALQTIHAFNGSDGESPTGGLIRGLDGWYYGTTLLNFYRIGPKGSFEVLHTFDHYLGFGNPTDPLLQASDGNFYGVTSSGGGYDLGTIFMVTPQGQAKLLYSFGAPNTYGWIPVYALIQAADGDLYGFTNRGGAYFGGIVFKISLQGNYQKVYDFPGGYSYSYGPPIQASDGNLWGTLDRGPNNNGTVFAITTSGSLVHSVSLPYGFFPQSGLVQSADGRLYGVGFTNAKRYVIYAIDAALPPPVASIAGFTPASGSVGSKVVVSGAHFVGVTAVAFNGANAGFVINADGVISATVPTGALSGPIQITTPGGTVTSQTDFTVIP